MISTRFERRMAVSAYITVLLLVCAFVAEHIFLIVPQQLHPAQVIEACLTPKRP
jgi:hypothetical protein